MPGKGVAVAGRAGDMDALPRWPTKVKGPGGFPATGVLLRPSERPIPRHSSERA